MSRNKTLQALLLSYISLVLERNSIGPGDGGEFILWDDLMLESPSLVSSEEKKELIFLVESLQQWACDNMNSRMLELISLEEWYNILENRGH